MLNYFSENWLFFQEITFITEFQGSKILLPTFSLGGKWGFEVADLLLAIVNFEPWSDRNTRHQLGPTNCGCTKQEGSTF